MFASRVFRRTVLTAFLAAVGLNFSHSALGQAQTRGKPGSGGGSVPPGTLYYTDANGDIYGIQADGSGKSLALPRSVTNFERLQPSNRLYGGGHRWWLALRDIPGVFNPFGNSERELFAYRLDPLAPDGVRRVQLTNFGTEIWPNYLAQWSNDGQDSFVSFMAYDYRRYNVSGNVADLDVKLFRLAISGAEIEAAANANVDPRLGASDVETIVAVLASDVSEIVYHHWSPDGTQVAYLPQAPGSQTGNLLVKDVSTGQTRQLRAGLGLSNVFRWSPGGRTILLSAGNIMTLDAGSGGVVQTIVQSSSKFGCADGVWSPATGADISFTGVAVTQGGLQHEYSIYRVPASGGTAIALTDRTLGTDEFNVAWVSDELAP